MKKVKIFHIYFGYGWMFGKRPTLFFWNWRSFIKRQGGPMFYILNAFWERERLTYASGFKVFDRDGNMLKDKSK